MPAFDTKNENIHCCLFYRGARIVSYKPHMPHAYRTGVAYTGRHKET